MKSKLEIYALSVCFTAVVSLVISVGIAGYSVFEILTPELTMSSYEYDRLQTNDAYRASKPLCNERENTEQRPSEEELTKQRKEAFEMEIRSEKRKGFQTLIQCMIFIFASGVALFIHWKMAKKARMP